MGEQPRRIQLSRRKGARLPPNTVVVSRPGKLGNPFNWREAMEEYGCSEREAKQWAKDTFLELCMLALSDQPDKPSSILHRCPSGETIKATLRQEIPKLTGKNVACWCGLNDPCHGDVYLVLANPGIRCQAA